MDLEFRQLVERVKLRSPIETVVSGRVPELKKRGALLWARCPFHEERTPSFAVDPRKGTWRCYGACGEGGDALSFVQRFDGLGFLDALRLLAQACGEELPRTALRARSRERDARLEALYDVLERAAKLYRRELHGPGGRAALRYAGERGLSEETLKRFALGWSPESGNPVLESATRAGVDLELLVEAGLCKRADDGRPYDFFHGRLMIPIRDRLGRTLGFGGRLLPGASGKAKYVNTPETRLFKKGQLVYGLDLAQDAVRRGHHLVLVEGYTDVMAAHQVGMPHVAAILGTSTTEDHAALVRRSAAQRVTLVFDGDAAGRQATLRALRGLLPLGIEIHVAAPEAGSDPCDLLLGEGGSERFGALVDESRDWFDWVVDSLRQLEGARLAEGVDELFVTLETLTKPVERAARLRALAPALELPEEALQAQWLQFERGRRSFTPPPAEEPLPEPAARADDPGLQQAFRSLIGALLLDNSLIPLYAELGERCPEGDLSSLFRTLLELYEDGDPEQPIDASRLMTALGDDPVRDRVSTLVAQAETAESPQALARDQELWLERRVHEHELALLRRRLEGAQSDEEAAQGVLRNLHAKLRSRRVTPAKPPA